MESGEKYLSSKVAKKIEHTLQTKEKWDKTIYVPIDVLPEKIAILRNLLLRFFWITLHRQ